MDGRDAMLALGMNGEPLPFVHGFPLRMLVPAWTATCPRLSRSGTSS